MSLLMISKVADLASKFFRGLPMVADHPKKMVIINEYGKIMQVDIDSAHRCDIYFKGIRAINTVSAAILENTIRDTLAIDTDVIWVEPKPETLYVIHSYGISKLPFMGTRGELELLAIGLADFDFGSAQSKLSMLLDKLPKELQGKYVDSRTY